MSTDIKGNRFLLIFLVCRRTTMLHVTILDKITFITQQSVSSKPVPVISYLLTYPRLLGSKQSPGRGRGRGMELVPTDQECPSWVALLSTRSSSKQNTKMDEAEGKRRQGSRSFHELDFPETFIICHMPAETQQPLKNIWSLLISFQGLGESWNNKFIVCRLNVSCSRYSY